MQVQSLSGAVDHTFNNNGNYTRNQCTDLTCTVATETPSLHGLLTERPSLMCMINLGEVSSSGLGGKVGGGVLGALLFISAAITVIVLVCFVLKWRNKNRVKRLQMDIFEM